LTTLAAEGYLSFNESVFLPSRLSFACSKDYLHRFETEQPALDPIIKVLLRTYEGIFDNEVNIHERTLARILNIEIEAVIQQLQSLVYYEIIKYTPKKDTPQVFYPYSRVPAAEVIIDAKGYEVRKQRYINRVRAIIRYAFGKQCRSQQMQQYFGEEEVGVCGVCDYCLSKKRLEMVGHAQLLDWLKQSEQLLANNPVSIDELRNLLGITRFQADKLVELGLSEEIFNYDDKARLILIKNQ
jgi:ATP-dependent DNA helicase RecQ